LGEQTNEEHAPPAQCSPWEAQSTLEAIDVPSLEQVTRLSPWQTTESGVHSSMAQPAWASMSLHTAPEGQGWGGPHEAPFAEQGTTALFSHLEVPG